MYGYFTSDCIHGIFYNALRTSTVKKYDQLTIEFHIKEKNIDALNIYKCSPAFALEER